MIHSDVIIGRKYGVVTDYNFQIIVNCSESGEHISGTKLFINVVFFYGIQSTNYSNEQLNELFNNQNLHCSIINKSNGKYLANVIFLRETNEIILPKF